MTDNASWQPLALHDLEHTDMSIVEVADKYGRSQYTVQKLLYRSGIVRKVPNKRRGPIKRADGNPISNNHKTIGLRLNLFRAGENSRDFAEKLGISTPLLSSIEAGQHDIKLGLLLKITEVTGMSIPDLMRPFSQNLYVARTNARH